MASQYIIGAITAGVFGIIGFFIKNYFDKRHEYKALQKNASIDFYVHTQDYLIKYFKENIYRFAEAKLNELEEVIKEMAIADHKMRVTSYKLIYISMEHKDLIRIINNILDTINKLYLYQKSEYETLLIYYRDIQKHDSGERQYIYGWKSLRDAICNLQKNFTGQRDDLYSVIEPHLIEFVELSKKCFF